MGLCSDWAGSGPWDEMPAVSPSGIADRLIHMGALGVCLMMNN